ncbi:MAG: signal peptidase I [Candidatus Pacebacteria bacterium]|nr:signal peptidase I [Candidatus Paceibacterota bacterium]
MTIRRGLYIGIVGLCALCALGLFFHYREHALNTTQNVGNITCVTREYEALVQGVSLEEIVKPGSLVRVQEGFYNCNPVRRGDVVAYHYAGNAAPVIKIVYGIPGDAWRVSMSASGTTIILNEQNVTTPAGKTFLMTSKRAQMLSMYARDYPIIPADTYLLLGTDPWGTLDSSRFGLVHKNDLIGRARAQ